MPRSARFRSLAVVTVFALVVTLALFIPNASANDGDDDVATLPEKTELPYPNLSTHLNHLAEGYGSGPDVPATGRGRSAHSFGRVGGRYHPPGWPSLRRGGFPGRQRGRPPQRG